MSQSDNRCSAGSSGLLPCPFCGGEAGYYDCAPQNAAGVVCNACGLSAEPNIGATRAEARARWNTRIPSVAQPQPELPPIVDRDELIALLQDLASVNLSREACERQARRMADDLIARGLTLAAQPPAAPVDLTNHHNALKCPYCNPKGLQFAEPLERLSAATAIEQWEREWPDRPCGWEDSEARLRLMEIIRAVPQTTRESIIEECAKVCDQHAASRLEIRELLAKGDNDAAANNFGMEFQAARFLAAAIRALSSSTLSRPQSQTGET